MTSRKRKKKKYHKKTRKIRLISPTLFKKYNALSPFELKNNLIKMAEGKNPDQMLNAGRGSSTPVRATVSGEAVPSNWQMKNGST